MMSSLYNDIEKQIEEEITAIEKKYGVNIDEEGYMFYCKLHGELLSADNTEELEDKIKDFLSHNK